MFLKEAIIRNFRSLKNVDIIFDDTTILIGENNAGKSAILEAIKKGLLYGTGTKDGFDDFDFYMDSEISNPKDSDGIKIILIFEERVPGEWDGFISDNFVEAFQYINNEKASIILQTSAKFNSLTSDIEVKTVFLNNDFEQISGGVQKYVNRAISIIPVFYLQALRNIKDTFSSKSVLWGRFMRKVSIPGEELLKIQNEIKQLNNNIISNDENLSNLVNELQKVQKVMNFEEDVQELVSINAVPIKGWDLLSKAQVVLNNGYSGIDLPIERHGQGTQSVTAILLFKAYIGILLKKINSNSAEAILTLEEPEAHLHPQAIRALQRAIEEIECQKIITTHSPFFIQNADIRSIRFIKRENGISKVNYIQDHISFHVDNVNEALIQVSNAYNKVIKIDEENAVITLVEPLNETIANAMRGCCKDLVSDTNIDEIISSGYLLFKNSELCDLNMYIQRNRGDILFAKKWFLYEGQSEDVIIPYMARILGKDFDEHGINGIMYRNNGTAGSFVKLAKVLDIRWVMLGDNDEQGKSTINEVVNSGYKKDEISNVLLLTKTKDFEHELAEIPTILRDYEMILGEKITEELKMLKNSGKEDEYKEKVVRLIQEGKGKVENAYKLISIWDERKFSEIDIPETIKKLIEEV